MLQILQLVTLLLLAAAWAFALAHAAEMPGTRRLDRATYFAVQRIYYPGFTIGGASEPLAILALLALLFAVPAGEPVSGALTVALTGAVAAHGVYWLISHPISKVWLKEQTLARVASASFASEGEAAVGSWVSYRDRWEYSHVARTALLTVSLIALAVTLIE
jgi:hypothetical protein